MSNGKRKICEKKNIFKQLPADCWYEIFSFFKSSKTIVNLLCTCKYVNTLLQNKLLNFCDNVEFSLQNTKSGDFLNNTKEKLYFVHKLKIFPTQFSMQGLFWGAYKKDEKGFEKIMNICPNVKELKIDGTKVNVKIRMSTIAKYKNLQFLNLSGKKSLSNPDKFFEDLNKLKKLKIVELKELAVPPGEALEGTIQNLKNLEKLVIRNAGYLTIDFVSKSLKHLVLHNYVYSRKKKTKLPNLESLEFILTEKPLNPKKENVSNYSDYFCDLPEELIQNNAKTLRNLKLQISNFDYHNYYLGAKFEDNKSYIPKFSPNQKRSFVNDKILSKCKNLEVLNINRTDIFNGRFLQYLGKLKKMSICGCKNITAKMIGPYISDLESLDMSFCNQKDFGDEFLRTYLSGNLEILNMAGCDQDTISNYGFKKFKNLRILNIRDCNQSGIKAGILKTLFKNNKNLESIQIYSSGYKVLRDSQFGKFRRVEVTGKHFSEECFEHFDIFRKSVWVVPDKEFMKDKFLKCKTCKRQVSPWICEECEAPRCPYCDERKFCNICNDTVTCENCVGECIGVACDEGECCVNCIKRNFVKCGLCGRYFCGEGCGGVDGYGEDCTGCCYDC